jgi:hypothetical protein
LIGLDAGIINTLKNCDSSQVIFDHHRKRLLLRGTSDSLGRPQEPARLWDSTTGQFQTSELAGDGPIAFRGDGTAIQLVPKDLWTFDLRDVAQRHNVGTFHVSSEGKPEPMAGSTYPMMSLSTNGSMAAVCTKVAAESWQLMVWETASGKMIKEIAAGYGFALCCRWPVARSRR